MRAATTTTQNPHQPPAEVLVMQYNGPASPRAESPLWHTVVTAAHARGMTVYVLPSEATTAPELPDDGGNVLILRPEGLTQPDIEFLLDSVRPRP